MPQRAAKIAMFFAGILLLVTSLAKIFSANGNAAILQKPDPLLSVSFQYVFWIAGTLEFIVATYCFCGGRLVFQASLVAWIATNFALYRFGLFWIGWHKPCSCMGNLTDALNIPPQTADTAMKIILAYLLIGSYATLFWLWRQRKNAK